MSRGTVIVLMVLAGVGTAAAGYHWFLPLMKFICVGAFPQFVRFHSGAEQLARDSFATAAGLAGASVPLAALVGLGFARKGRYGKLFGPALLMALLAFVAVLLVYRHEMQAFGSTTGELFGIFQDSRRSLALNPLTRAALIAAVASLGYGVFEWLTG